MNLEAMTDGHYERRQSATLGILIAFSSLWYIGVSVMARSLGRTEKYDALMGVLSYLQFVPTILAAILPLVWRHGLTYKRIFSQLRTPTRYTWFGLVPIGFIMVANQFGSGSHPELPLWHHMTQSPFLIFLYFVFPLFALMVPIAIASQSSKARAIVTLILVAVISSIPLNYHTAYGTFAYTGADDQFQLLITLLEASALSLATNCAMILLSTRSLLPFFLYLVSIYAKRFFNLTTQEFLLPEALALAVIAGAVYFQWKSEASQNKTSPEPASS
ncbi:MAG: hypothetical protein JST51_09195 [Armatimonadetes bacterium]|nr:hypothetical protein [Armatimonadota bacterium]